MQTTFEIATVTTTTIAMRDHHKRMVLSTVEHIDTQAQLGSRVVMATEFRSMHDVVQKNT